MTAYAIDSGRWLVGDAEDGAPGAVPKAPPAVDAQEPTAGQPWPRWYRFEWRIEAYTPPAAVTVPAVVTMRQARIALLGAGLLDDVEAAIDAIADPATRQAARITWDYSSEVQRHNGFVSMLAPAMGLTDEQLDQLFVAAAAL